MNNLLSKKYINFEDYIQMMAAFRCLIAFDEGRNRNF